VSIRLRGDRVGLRPFRERDVDVLAANGPAVQDAQARERLRGRIAASGTWHHGRSLELAVEADGVLIGDVQARRSDDLLPPGVFEIGIGLFADVRGKGYGTEAVRLLTAHLFDEEHATRVQLGTDVENVKMRRAAERAGFRFEGVMRGYWSEPDGTVRDYALYGRTRRDHEGR
jgi:RimJ/RimL family protein N-acetyltransferase